MTQKIVRWILVSVFLVSIAVFVAGRVHPAAADTMPLSRVMPRGALAYVQARNLGEMLGKWRTSSTAAQYFKSKSYESFTRSRLYIKLQERTQEFEQGLGFSLTEDKVLNLAGGESAVTMYDMGKLELVYVTEMPAAQAMATVLYKQSARFEARKRGTSEYYVQELATDAGRMRQGLCFAAAGGKFIVTTTEPLMQRSLDNLANLTGKENPDRLSDSMAATLAAAEGFTAHDVTLWTDVPRLRAQRFFNLYWVQTNQAPLDQVSATLADLEFSQGGVREHRWSLLNETGTARNAAGAGKEAATNLIRFAPAEAQAVEVFKVSSNVEQAKLTRTVAGILFPAVPPVPKAESLPTPPAEPSANLDESNRFERYRRLDQRFDQDIDDPGAQPVTTESRPIGPSPEKQDQERFEKALTQVLARTQPVSFARLGNAQEETATGFVRLSRAVVIEMKSNFDASAFETLITGELNRRLLVGGAGGSREWKTAANGVRVPPVGIVEQGGVYLVVDNYLILANSPDYAGALVAAWKLKKTPLAAPQSASVEHFAWVRLDAGRKAYRKLMGKLEYVPGTSTTLTGEEAGEGGGEGEGDSASNEAVPFLSGNLGSLLDVFGYVSDMTIESSRSAKSLEEQVFYRYGAAG
ncbi:MAG: hypothetical protein K1Y36_01185 [Blastocatellia bacterium]|nr:hypothetical protein [Blastocatellia bacterium]